MTFLRFILCFVQLILQESSAEEITAETLRVSGSASSAPALGRSGRAAFPLLFVHDTLVLTSPNAMARYLNPAAFPAECEGLTDQWLAWEETVLRPAAYGATGPLEQARAELANLPGNLPALAKTLLACTVVAATHTGVNLGRHAPAVSGHLGAGEDAAVDSVVCRADASVVKRRYPKLPVPGARNILVTSALPYVNNVPHLGNIIGCVLSADCYARFVRARGDNVVYVCGTDEYGTATETKAIEEGKTPQEICDHYHAIHADIYRWFDIDFDKFGRTPTRQQTEIGQRMFKRLQQQGMLVEETKDQLYSTGLQKFLADRYVTGTCPKCAYDDARGDQCDGCGGLLNPTELLQPKCKFSGTTPILKPTTHMYLDLPQLEDKLRNYVTEASGAGSWTSNCVAITNHWLRDGLRPRCITRDLKWGTPVPLPGYEDKVFYVWFDAPIGYISITANYTDQWQQWWQPQDPTSTQVELVQFMGKDNVPFHTIIFPSTLIGTGDNWTKMKKISVTEYLNYEGGKFSKSRGTGVFGNDAKDTGIPSEVWRYYLLVNRPENDDSDFHWNDLASKNNGELLANLGNFVNRVVAYTVKNLGGRTPDLVPEAEPAIAALSSEVSKLATEYTKLFDQIKIKEALKCAMNISRAGNQYLQETTFWSAFKTNPALGGAYLRGALGLITCLAAFFQPFMPSVSKSILSQIGLDYEEYTRLDDHALLDRCANLGTVLPRGHTLSHAEPMFRTITPDEVTTLRAKYGGNQAETLQAAAAAAAVAGGGSAQGGKGNDRGGAKSGKDGKGGSGAPAATKPKEDPNRAVDVSRLDLRVGVILEAWRHPDAESLYVEKIDLGEGQPRQVVSGLVKHIPLDQMVGARVVCVCNMKPAKMRGIESQAMVLCGENADASVVEMVRPPPGAQPGDRLGCEGFPGEPDAQLNPKKKVFEGVQLDLKSDKDKVVGYKGVPFRTLTGGEVCTTTTLTDAKIR